MSKRPTLADLAAAAGVSIATVDRVLNSRHRVREPTAERVLGAAEAMGFQCRAAAEATAARRNAGPRVRLSAARTQRLLANWAPTSRRRPATGVVPWTGGDRIRDRAFARRDRRSAGAFGRSRPRDRRGLGRSSSRRRGDRSAAEQGKPTFALLSDLTAEARAGYVGRDNRKEGRTAAWLIAKAAPRPGKIGIIVGSHRYLCQETAEISFRAWLRENAPGFEPLEPLVNLDDSRLAHDATLEMIAHHRDLSGSTSAAAAWRA